MQNSNVKYKYKFSVIMAIYNVEEYLGETIESIINQDIGFEKNIQLILVNDGSEDNSEEICLKYKELYPNNIIYKKKKNGGPSSARNLGMKYIEGEITTFTDSDDILAKNAMAEVYKYYKRNKLCINQICIPLYFFDAKDGLHGKYKYMGEKNRTINLLDEPYNFVLSSASMFYKSEVIKNMRFDEELIGAEDTKFNCILYNNNPLIGYVCENSVLYYYRKRENNTSLVDSLSRSNDSFSTVTKVFETFDLKNLKSYEMEIIIYELRSRLQNIKKSFYDEEEDYNKIIEKYKFYINLIPTEFILNYSKWVENTTLKMLFLKFRNIDYRSVLDNKLSNTDIKVTLNHYYIKNNKLYLELTYNDYNSDLSVVAYDGKNRIYNAIKNIEIDGPFNATYGEFILGITRYEKFEFSLKSNKVIKFLIYDKKNKKYYPITNLMVDKYSKLALKDDVLGLRYKNKIVKLINRKIKISTYKKSSLVYNINTICHILIEYKKLVLLRLLNRRKKKYILIGDRPNKAGDNGEALFKYINKYRKDIAKYTYFYIDKKSPDFDKIKKIGKVVKLKGLKHKYLFMNSKYIYSSHTHRLFYNAFDLDDLKYYSDTFNYKFIWLQHGITKDDISRQANFLNIKADHIIAATQGEYSEFTKDKYFYDDEAILLTGFARYDLLKDKSKKIITIAPTWRRELTGKILEDGTQETLPGFTNSAYYKQYKLLLTNKKLNEFLEKSNYKIYFILHPGMSGYIDYFKEFETDNISVKLQEEITYSNIFEVSKLLITDYSSIFFDFAYLKKPEIFFQFDSDTFFKSHYQKGDFDYKKDAFGDIIIDVEELVDKILFYNRNEFKMEEKYIKRVDKTFKYTDENNSKRILDKTLK